MRGLGGAEKRKCSNCMSEVVKGGPRNPVKGTAERDGAVGGGRGRVNPPPWRLVWRFGGLLLDSGHIHA